jgi:SAM-dependent methyltransferase
MSDLSPLDDVAGMFSVDDYMYFYSDFLNPQHSDQETYAIANLLVMDTPMRVLDLACGFGRIANRLARLGHDVLGIEYQGGFVQLARVEADQMHMLNHGGRYRGGGRVDYRQSDMREIDFANEFDRVIMVFNSFGYFTDEENFRLLQSIARALKPGGFLGFDIANRDGVFNDFHPHYVSEKEDNLLINRFSFDVETGRLRNDRIVIRDGVRKDRPFSIRLYSVTEMRGLLAEAGLEMDGVYGEWDGRELRFDSPAMVVVARKEGEGETR